MPLLDNELARRENGRLDLRPQPLRVRWDFEDLLAADGQGVNCAFECSVKPVDDPTERRMLQEVLLRDRAVLTAPDVVDHFEKALRPAAQRAVQGLPAEECLAEGGKKAVLDALRAAAKPVAFAAGLELLSPFHVETESPSLQRERLREMQRHVAEQQAAGQVEHFQRAADLLKQFQSLRKETPDLSPGHLLQQVSPADRGSMLQTLLLASAKDQRAEDLWAVAGPYLVRIDARVQPAKAELTPLPPTVGPMRSVQPADVDGRRVLLVGAQSGFMLVHPNVTGEAEAYGDAGVRSQLGFNRVVYWGKGKGFIGCHGEAGLVRWEAGKTDEPVQVLRPERLAGYAEAPAPPPAGSFSMASRVAGPRNVQVLDDETLIFSVGGRVLTTDMVEVSALPAESTAEVVEIVPDEKHVTVVHENGTVCVLDRATRKVLCKERRGGRVRAAGALPWLGTRRLLLAGDEGPVQCVGYDDPLVTQYVSPHRGLRVITASTDLVAAVSADRQRVVFWNSWDGRQPAGEVYLVGLARHRAADISFA